MHDIRNFLTTLCNPFKYIFYNYFNFLTKNKQVLVLQKMEIYSRQIVFTQ